MRRTEQEFKAEVFCRSSECKKRRKEKIRKSAMGLGFAAVLILAVPMLPGGLGGDSAEKLEMVMDSVSMVQQAPADMPEAPAAEQKSESMNSPANGAPYLNPEPEEESPEEGVPVYEIQVSLYLSDGNWEEWIIRGEDRIRAVTDALQAFRDSDSANSVPEGISEQEDNWEYTIFFWYYNECYSFSFYANHNALWNNFDGGYWVGQDVQAAKELMDALQKE